MGSCNSAQSLERSCARQLRRVKEGTGSSSSSSSSSSSPSLPAASKKAGSSEKPIGEAAQAKLPAAATAQTRTAGRSLTEKQKDCQSSGASQVRRQQLVASTSKNPDEVAAQQQQQQQHQEQHKIVEKPANDAAKADLEQRAAKLAKLKEGVDFIETEEDAEAVESAVVKIQSTFRGKKIRSKLGGGGAQSSKAAAAAANSASAATKGEEASTAAAATQSSAEGQSASATNTNSTATNKEEELNEKVAEMQVNDNREATAQKPADREQPVAPEEADRAATKIQAGFKGYKTRKELEGKLGGSSGSGGGQGSGVPAAGSAAGSQQEGKEQ